MSTIVTTTRRRTTLLAAAVLVLLLAGIAYAAWTAVGSGTATAEAGTSVDLTMTGSAAEPLVPGGSSDVAIDVDNPNPYNVSIESITGVVSTTGGDCEDVTFAPQTIAADTQVVAADGSLAMDLNDALSMSDDAGDDCQGADFSIALTLSGLSTVADAD